jgi:ketosteroid isomerase-like protein
MIPGMRIPAMFLVAAAIAVRVAAQPAALPQPLSAMVAAERAFAQRATVVGWKQAFLDFFADDATAFDGDKTVPAREQVRQAPDPPKDVQLLWEPRYGDAAASGELGWLTGPSTTINPARNNGAPRHGNYASVWKRQPDGTFKVVLDVGVNLPMAAPFAPGFTRAPSNDRYDGADSVTAATRALRDADRALNEANQLSPVEAFTGRLAAGARFHRNGILPLTGDKPILDWLRTQPDWVSGDSRYVEVAQSRDLGYSYGTYATPAGDGHPAEKGFYARVWTRGRDGAWRVILDVAQPQ